MKKEFNFAPTTMEERTTDLATAIREYKVMDEALCEKMSELVGRIKNIEELSYAKNAMPSDTYYLVKEAVKIVGLLY